MSQENVEIVRRAQDAANRRDVAALSALMAPDCEIVPLRASVEDIAFRGRNGVAAWFAAQDEAWEVVTARFETVRADRDWVLVFGRLRAQGRSSGTHLDVPAAAVWRLAEGLITRLTIYTNRDEALKAVGLDE
jgi:ketosteroid isomerase-like protein